MKNKSLLIFVLALFCLSLIDTAQAQSRSGNSVLYGYSISTGSFGAVKFDVSEPETVTQLNSNSGNTAAVGENVNGIWYVAYGPYQSNNFNGYYSSFSKLDFPNGAMTSIRNNFNDITNLRDMAYDHSTDNMYVIKLVYGSGRWSDYLATINLTTGMSSNVAPLTGVEEGATFLALACSTDGQLYGMSSKGQLYKIDKETGEGTKLPSHTGAANGIKFQSMTFDHKSKKIYWANAETVGNSTLYEVDPATGTAQSKGSIGKQITALTTEYYKLDEEAPANITGLQVVANASGALSANISWTNPVTDYSGNPLTNPLTKINIYRNGEKTHTITNNVSETMSWVDTDYEKAGNYTYMVLPENAIAENPWYADEVTVFVGKDIPAKVENLVLENPSGNNIKLTWTAPTTGANNGYFDPTGMTYTITRLPDEIQKTVSVLEFTETIIGDLAKYSYTVAAVNAEGEGPLTTSNALVLGDPFTALFDDFENAESFNLWSTTNYEAISYWAHSKWSGNPGSCLSAYQYSSEFKETWVYTPPLQMKAGKKYQVKWDHQGVAASITLNLCHTPTNEGVAQEIAKQENVNTEWVYYSNEYEFEVTQDGVYHLAWAYNAAAQYNTYYIDNVSVDKLPLTSFSDDFSDSNFFKDNWTIISDGKGTWEHYNWLSAVQGMNWVADLPQGDAWMFTPAMSFEEGKTYEVSWEQESARKFAYKLVLTNSLSKEASLVIPLEEIASENGVSRGAKIKTFTVEESGTYHVAWVYTGDYQSSIYLYNVDIREKPNYASISGVVKDANSNPLKEVAVKISGRKNETVTDEQGQYRIERILPGTVTIEFSKFGYKTVSMQDYNLEENTDITGLDATLNIEPMLPQPVKNAIAYPIESGSKIKLEWFNPTLDIAEHPLTGTLKINIYEGKGTTTKITTLESAVAGAKMSYEYTVPAGQQTTFAFSIKVENEVAEEQNTSYYECTNTQDDYPGKVGNLSVVTTSAGVELSWDAPIKGNNNGWYDNTSLKYTVKRSNNIIADDLTLPAYIDDEDVSLHLYSYKVLAKNSNGSSASSEVTVNEIIAGTSVWVPWSEMLVSASVVNKLWTITDKNEDGISWSQYTVGPSDYGVRILSSATEAGNDLLITPPIKMESGEFYKLTWQVKANSSSPEIYKVYLNSSKNISGEPIYKNESLNSTGFTTVTAYVRMGENINDPQYFIWEYTGSAKANGGMVIRQVSLEKLTEKDIAITNFEITESGWGAAEDEETAYITLLNDGAFDSEAFSIKIVDEDNNVLKETLVTESIASGTSQSLELPLRLPATTGEVVLRAFIVQPEPDDNPENDEKSQTLRLFPKGSIITDLGKREMTSEQLPMSAYRHASASQTVYTAAEVNGYGEISAIRYFSNNPAALSRDVKIYMGTTPKDTLQWWLPEAELVEVFSGNYLFPQGESEVLFILDKPFVYYKDNLVVLNEVGNFTKSIGMNSVFYQSKPDGSMEHKSLYWHGLTMGAFFNFKDQPTASANIPDVTMAIEKNATGALHGTITDKDGVVSGASVHIVENGYSVNTNEQGLYNIGYLAAGKYTLEVYKAGWLKASQEITVNEGENVLDIELTKLLPFTLSGKVTGAGSPVAGATIALSGYTNYSTKTSSDGNFVIENVYGGQEYLIFVESNHRFKYYTETFTMGNAPTTHNISLEEYLNAPQDINAEIKDEAANITWEMPVQGEPKQIHQHDNGVQAGTCGEIPSPSTNPLYAIFAVYPDATIVTDVTWFIDNSNGSHPSVNVYVGALDAAGKPLPGAPKYMKAAIKNKDGEWNTYQLEQELVMPNGFFVGIGRIANSTYTNLSLGIDAGPAKENVYFYSNMLDTYHPYEVEGNIMIRAKGYQIYNGDSKSRGSLGYNIYRVDEANVETKLNTETLTELSFIDDAFATLPNGTYRYAVEAIYAGDNQFSEKAYSNEVSTKNEVKLTLNIKTQEATGTPSGAQVTLTQKDNTSNTYTANVGTDGKATFENVVKEDYEVTIDKETYHLLKTHLDLSAVSNVFEVAEPYVIVLIGVPSDVTAAILQSDITLSWKAPTEEDEIKGYNIYRDATKINDEAVAATTFEDKGLSAGVYVYTVTTVLNDGRESVKSEEETAEIKVSIASAEPFTLALYPNPVNDKLFIETEELANIRIFDISGKEVHRSENKGGSTTINTEHFPAGMYLIKITNKSHGEITRKFIVNR